MIDNQPKLSWVLIDNNIHSVEDFVGIPIGQRPTARCPVCNQIVILKLGNERIHHAAHLDGAICATTQPETALHLNVKYYIWNQLKSAHVLSASWKCAKCDENLAAEVAKDWDVAMVEYPLSSWRADIALIKDGKPICAIEIRVTHPTEPEKIDALKMAAIPIVEVEATDEIYQSPSAWTPDFPLPSLLPCVELTCKSCQEALENNRTTKTIRYLEPKDFDIWKVVWMRFADVYYPSGKKFRETYKVMIQYRLPEKKAIKVLLTRGLKQSKWTTINAFYPPWKKDTGIRIQESFRQDLLQIGGKGTIHDSPMSWLSWDGSTAHSVDNYFLFKERYKWGSVDNGWQIIPELANLRWDDKWPITRNELDMMLEIVARNHGIIAENAWERNEYKRRWEHQTTGEFITDSMLETEAREQYNLEKKKRFPFLEEDFTKYNS